MRRERGRGLAWAIAVPLLASGCSTSHDVPDGSMGDSGVTDVPPPGCAMRASGAEPFSVELAGSAEFTDRLTGMVHTGEIALDAYFLGGRVAGGAVVLSVPTRWPASGVATTSVVLDSTSSAPVDWRSHDSGDFSLAGWLVGPDDGIRAHATRNFAFMTDHLEEGEADMTLCPTGPTPPPAFELVNVTLEPTSVLRLAPSVPLEGTSLTLGVGDGVSAVPVDVTADTGVRAIPRARIFPPSTPLEIDARGTVDVLGRPLSASATLPWLTTSAVLTDLSLDTRPPPGSVAPEVFADEIVDGTLVLTARYGTSPSGVLLSIGDVPGASVGVTWAGGCFAEVPDSIRVAFVAADGSASFVPTTCVEGEGRTEDRWVARPGPGPLWLSISFDPPAWRNGSTPPHWNTSVRIAAILTE